MNLRQPYERIMAGKLRQLPVPDQERSWEQMKKLLDDEDHKTGGGGKRPPGSNYRWWRLALLALVASTAGWFYTKIQPSGTSVAQNQESAPAHAPGSASNAKKSSFTKDNTIAQNYTPQSNQTGLSEYTNEKNKASKINQPADRPSAEKTTGNPSTNTNRTQPEEIATGATVHQDEVPRTSAEGNIKNQAGGNNQTPGARSIKNENLHGTGAFSAPATAGSNQKNKKQTAGAGKSSDGDIAASQQSLPVSQSTAQNTDWFTRLSGLTTTATPAPTYNTSMAVGDSMARPADLSTMLNADTKKAVARAQREAMMNKKEKKSLQLDLSDLFHAPSFHIDTDPKWAAGIALNSTAAVADQSRYNYNINANSGTVLDYIPSPYLQFHLNRTVYLQTELNFAAPQYTAPTLIYQNNSASQSAVYIQKLYYFNWPLSLHYSPITNLYLAGGLQFSSFQSGLASVQQQSGGNTYSTTLKFKDDSIASKITPNEWRWQTGADYYWNRFTVGMRYNQSFSELFHSSAGSSSAPLPSTRNTALIFYMKYNLFESKRSSEENKKTLAGY